MIFSDELQQGSERVEFMQVTQPESPTVIPPEEPSTLESPITPPMSPPEHFAPMEVASPVAEIRKYQEPVTSGVHYATLEPVALTLSVAAPVTIPPINMTTPINFPFQLVATPVPLTPNVNLMLKPNVNQTAQADGEMPLARPKRGRPKGSKNKPKPAQ